MNKLILLVLVLLTAGCKEKFISPAPTVVTGYMVVEGVVNNEGLATNITLSRTTNLYDTSKKYETGATVTVEDSHNTSMLLTENSAGIYTIYNLHLDTTLKYRLAIKTSNNEEYLSDFVSVKKNPLIDSINWERDNNGVHIFINTHDPLNNTLYYQWEFEETWEFHSGKSSILKYLQSPPPSFQKIGVAFRELDDPNIYICWQFNASSNIFLGSSAKLSQDVIHLPLVTIAPASVKLSVLYSILVKQYVWSKEGYEFLERMKNNTESIGSVFDAQPSELNGNIHCTTNPKQPVIGFFNICTIQENRIFIHNTDLPYWNYNYACNEIVIENNRDSIMIKADGLLPTTPQKMDAFGSILTFYASPAECVDCTLSGTNIKPTYWP